MKRLITALTDAGHLAPRRCVGSKYHSPTPLAVAETEVAGNQTLLCGTCTDNLRLYLSLMTASNGSLSWEIRREFGNLIRALGTDEWEHRSAGG